jgi:hypothetical protein
MKYLNIFMILIYVVNVLLKKNANLKIINYIYYKNYDLYFNIY